MRKYLRHPFLIVCTRVVLGGFLTAIGRLASVSPARHCPDEENAEHRPAVERFPPGWPASNRNGRDQIGISGRLRSEHEDAFPVKREATPAVQVWTQRR